VCKETALLRLSITGPTAATRFPVHSGCIELHKQNPCIWQCCIN